LGSAETDGDFVTTAASIWTDWVNGWNKTGKAASYRVYDTEAVKDPFVTDTKKLMAEGFDQRSNEELARLLGHPDIAHSARKPRFPDPSHPAGSGRWRPSQGSPPLCRLGKLHVRPRSPMLK